MALTITVTHLRILLDSPAQRPVLHIAKRDVDDHVVEISPASYVYDRDIVTTRADLDDYLTGRAGGALDDHLADYAALLNQRPAQGVTRVHEPDDAQKAAALNALDIDAEDPERIAWRRAEDEDAAHDYPEMSAYDMDPDED